MENIIDLHTHTQSERNIQVHATLCHRHRCHSLVCWQTKQRSTLQPIRMAIKCWLSIWIPISKAAHFRSTFVNDMLEFLTMWLLIFFLSIGNAFYSSQSVVFEFSRRFKMSSCVYFDKAFRCGKQTMGLYPCFYLCVFALKTEIASNPKWVINRKSCCGRCGRRLSTATKHILKYKTPLK